MLFFLFFGHATWHVGSQFPDEETASFNHWTTTEVLRKAILLEDDFNPPGEREAELITNPEGLHQKQGAFLWPRL